LTALYSVYRSQRFDDLVGQEALVQTLKNALAADRVAHAYLFSGIRGTGKTSTARILAKAVNCENRVDGEPCNQCGPCLAITDSSATDLIEIDAASNRGIDEIRDLREKAKYLPALLKRKVYIIDEAHQLTPEAFNALLKTLEEPPGHVLFILCTTEAHKLPATIVSRCQRFDFRRITAEDIAARLQHIAGKESLTVDHPALELIAAMAQGSMRDAITMLDQMASAGVETIDADSVRRQLGLVSSIDIAGLLAAAARGDAAFVLRDLDRLAQQGADIRQLTNALADMARRAVLVSLGAADAANLGIEERAAASLTDVVASAGRGFAAAAFEAALAASSEMKQTHDPRLLLELLLLRLSGRPGADAPAAPVPSAGTADRSQPAPAADPPQAAPAAGPAAEPTAGAADAGLGAVQARWPALLDALKGTPPATRVKALLVSSSAAPAAMEADILTIGFRWAVHSEKAQEPLHRQALEAAIREVYGQTFRLQFKVVTMAPPADEPGPAQSAGDHGTGSQPGRPGPGAGDEGLVQAAQEILGARVVDVRSRESDAG
jgi:DNA polymerase III subunit gamma/tau